MAQTSNNPRFQAVPEIDEELEQFLVTSKLSVHLLENGRKSQPIEGVTQKISVRALQLKAYRSSTSFRSEVDVKHRCSTLIRRGQNWTENTPPSR